MAPPVQNQPKKSLTPNAQDTLVEHTTEYANLLAWQASIIAAQEDSATIKPSHVDRARRLLKDLPIQQSVTSGLELFAAGALVGACVENFPQAVFDGRQGPAIFFLLMGMAGTVLLFRAIFRDLRR